MPNLVFTLTVSVIAIFLRFRFTLPLKLDSAFMLDIVAVVAFCYNVALRLSWERDERAAEGNNRVHHSMQLIYFLINVKIHKLQIVYFAIRSFRSIFSVFFSSFYFQSTERIIFISFVFLLFFLILCRFTFCHAIFCHCLFAIQCIECQQKWVRCLPVCVWFFFFFNCGRMTLPLLVAICTCHVYIYNVHAGH